MFSSSVMSNSATPWTVALPDSSVHAIFQARILEWVAVSYSRGSFWPRHQTWVSCTSRILYLILYCTDAPGKRINHILTSLVAQTVKRLPTMWKTRVQSLGREDPLKKEIHWIYKFTQKLFDVFAILNMASLMAQSVNNLPAMQETACNAGDMGSISGSRRFPGEGNGNPL